MLLLSPASALASCRSTPPWSLLSPANRRPPKPPSSSLPSHARRPTAFPRLAQQDLRRRQDGEQSAAGDAARGRDRARRLGVRVRPAHQRGPRDGRRLKQLLRRRDRARQRHVAQRCVALPVASRRACRRAHASRSFEADAFASFLRPPLRSRRQPGHHLGRSDGRQPNRRRAVRRLRRWQGHPVRRLVLVLVPGVLRQNADPPLLAASSTRATTTPTASGTTTRPCT